jgi:hypothetical protein
VTETDCRTRALPRSFRSALRSGQGRPKALEDYRVGRTKPLDEILDQRH